MPTLNSKIRLCKNIFLDRNYTNVLNYSESDMLSLCESQSHLVASANDFSFIRNKGTISTPFSYDDALQSNYIAFQNPDYSNKWFFAWIDDVIYNGENNTEIKYTVDAWSTWFDYWTAKTCYVVREHVNDDTIGLHTLAENLNVEDVIAIDEQEDSSLSQYYWIAVDTAWVIKDGSDGTEQYDSDKGTQFSEITVYNKQIFGTTIILFKASDTEELVYLLNYIKRTNGDGHISDINNIFVVPSALISESTLTLHTAYAYNHTDENTIKFYTMPYTDSVNSISLEYNKPTSFTGINIKNNKCFCYHYNYLLVTNNIGNCNIYKYENFYNNAKVQFDIEVALSIGCSGKLVPKNYRGLTRDDDESIPLAKYPTCAWSSDAFTNWLTQNAVNIPSNLVFGSLGAGTQYSSQNASRNKTEESGGQSSIIPEVNLGINISKSIADTIGAFYTGALMPNIQGGQNTGDVTWAGERNTFTFKFMRAKDEVLKSIDDYFTRCGYRINSLKIPNITGRTYWNYVEIGATEDIGYGDVPSNFMDIINQACRNGVTIWHNHENIGNYSLNNTIVS